MDTEVLPPVYDLASVVVQDQLPAYAPATGPLPLQATVLEEYSFKTRLNGKTVVAELTLTAPKALSKIVPSYFQGPDGLVIDGKAILSLSSPETIQEVRFTIRGTIFSVGKGWQPGSERLPFLNLEKIIYTPETKDAKLTGRKEWPISIHIPREISLPSGPNQEVGTFRLPETSTDSHLFHSIAYEAFLSFRRSRFKSDYRAGTNIRIIPFIRPDPPSILRQVAYQENSPVLGPDVDPDGWQAAEPVTIRGKVFGVRSIIVECTLYLAKPLSYTRGSVIPIHILLESDDEQAADLLASPEAPILRLRRIVKEHGPKSPKMNAPSRKDIVDDYRLASFLPIPKTTLDPELPQVSFKRQLYGEVHLDRNLKPTTSIVSVKLEYFVALFPFKVAGFEPECVRGTLMMVPVEIATLNATGPIPKKYTTQRPDDIPVHKLYSVIGGQGTT